MFGSTGTTAGCFLGKCDDQELGPRCWQFSYCQILLQIVVRTVITSSLLAWTSSVWMLKTSADLPFLNDCTAVSTSLQRMGWSSCLSVCLWTVQYRWISFGLVIVQLRAVSCLSVLYVLFFCKAFSSTILDSSSFPLRQSGRVFDELVCPLAVVLRHIFFNRSTLLCSALM